MAYGQTYSPLQEQHRRIAEAMLQRGLNPQIQSRDLGGGIAELAASLASTYAGKRMLDRTEDERKQASADALAQIDTLGLDPKYLPIVKALTSRDPDAGLSTAAQLISSPAAESWQTLTDEEEKGLGLDTSGTYQKSSKGNVSVLTQPRKSELLTPEELAQQSQLRREGRAVTTIKNEGPLPPGYRAVRDKDGNITSLEVLPGSPAAAKEAEAAATQAAAAAAAKQTADIVTTKIKEATAILDEGGFPATGALGEFSKGVPTSPANRLQATIDTINSNLSIDALNAMRAASKTGGALGNVTEKELELLQSKVASLKLSQGEKQLRQNLKQVQDVYDQIINGPAPSTDTTPKRLKFDAQGNLIP